MIETTVISYLSSALETPVSGQTPPGPPASYCTVEKRGSDENNRLKAALIAVLSTAPSLAAAAALNERVKHAMAGLPEGAANVFSCRCTTDYNNTDTRTKEPRYAAIFRVVYAD